MVTQGSCRSWKTWKTMEFSSHFFHVGISWKFMKGLGESWKMTLHSYHPLFKMQYTEKNMTLKKILTEFWKNSYQIIMENHESCLGKSWKNHGI